MASSTSNDRGKQPVRIDDDSDVDDLDDVIDDFTPNSPAKPAPQTTATNETAIGPSPPPGASVRPPDGENTETTDTDFAEEFARQMEAMLRDLSMPEDPSSTADSPGTSNTNPGDDKTREAIIRAAWEEMFVKGMDDALSGVPDSVESNSHAAGDPEDAFQSSLRQATERLHRSDTELQADSQAGDDDELAALLDPGDDSELQKLLEGMMGQLMSKEVLYEPLKELNDKFPSYLASNRDKLSASDLARYEAQHACTSQIIDVFDDTGYREDNPEMTTKIIALMNKMQEHGAPPAEIMGELPPGLDLGPDGAPQLPDGCLIF